uniref:Uncharacterized protein n=1 Tax=Dinoroseobacter phage vB_DshS_R26L TaxID=3161158 RepID=A0AAU7VGP8_9CAUD
MNVRELAEALTKMVQAGHGDLPVHHVMGNGKEKSICGWELVSEGQFDSEATRAERGSAPRLKMFTDSPF